MSKEPLVFFEIKIPKDNEYTIEQAQTLLGNLDLWEKKSLFFKNPIPFVLEIACIEQKIRFIIAFPESQAAFFQSQLLAQYKDALITQIDDYLADLDQGQFFTGQLSLARPWYLPIQTADQFQDVDPLSSVLATMSKNARPEDILACQFVLVPAGKKWQSGLASLASSGGPKDANGVASAHPQRDRIELKASHSGFKTNLRIVTNNEEALKALMGSFGSFSSPNGNYFVSKKPGVFSKEKFKKSIFQRESFGKGQILNSLEISSLWHLPTHLITLPNIAWGRQMISEAPDDLPIAEGLSSEEKKKITFVAKTEFKNKLTTFGVIRKDRERHVYVVGKTGTGKTTLLCNMAIEDIRKGEGVAVIDPHGDLIQTLLEYIPKNRINDVCYFNPSDPDFDYPLNILEVSNPAQKELVASGIVSIFYKLYSHSWGPRMEHILRNTLLTLTARDESTLGDVIRILTDKNFRRDIVDKLDDKNLINFWNREFETMSANMQQEAISPILNKVGQFVSSPLIRRVIGYRWSRVKIEDIMNNGKILLVDLSSGKIGEDNSALLGAMIITQIQLAAMNRSFIPERERKSFYLYVDEFQNFATQSFIRILSEARKFKLNLTVANRYMAQLDQEIQDAILGNVGTLMTFIVGAQDAQVLDKEFGKDFDVDDLVSLGKYQILIKMSINDRTSNPFSASTLPLPSCNNKNYDKIIKMSRAQFGRNRKKS